MTHPGSYVYPIRLDDDGSVDQRSTFFGSLVEQLNRTCHLLSAQPELSANTTRIDALGFSQGGQFVRALLETCSGIEVRNLVTFGSQHNGISRFKECGTWDLLCRGSIGTIQGNVWSDFVQHNIVPAQYYREVDDETGLGSQEYLNRSSFLAHVNNEQDKKTPEFKKRISGLDNFVMYIFEDDKTVIPKESGWFAEVNATDGTVTDLRDRMIYKEDWLGLKELDEKGGLQFRTTPGGHMTLDEELLTDVFKEFFGPERNLITPTDRSRQNVLGNDYL